VHLLYGHDEAVAEFVARLIPGCERGFANYRAIGVVTDEGRLVGGMVFHHWSPEHGTIEVTSAATTPRWFTRQVMTELFAYPFRIGCQMVVLQTSERNTRLHRQLEKLGLRRHTIPRLYGRDEAGVIFTMTDDDWLSGRFMRHANGKAEGTHTSQPDEVGQDAEPDEPGDCIAELPTERGQPDHPVRLVHLEADRHLS
jgi:RimJ/RimL family protein N-acetyltransferase